MKKLILVSCLFLFASNAKAEMGANVGLVSDYVWRGVSATNHGAAVQGGLDFTHGIGVENLNFMAGVWGSNVVADSEFDYYGGFNYAFSEKFNVSLKYLFYTYVQTFEANTHEVVLATEYTMNDVFSFVFDANYTPDFFGTGTYCLYAHVAPTVNLPLSTYLTVNAGYSYFGDEAAAGESYIDYNVSLGKTTEDGFSYSVTVGDATKVKDTYAFVSFAKSI